MISLGYNINYYLIVPIDKAPQRLYSQRYYYRDVTSSLPSKRMRTNNQSRLASSKGIFEAGLTILPDAVFNFTTRSTSFEPPYVPETLLIGQCDRGISFIITITTSPTPKLCDFEFHFRQNVKMGKYSRTHLLQNISVAA